MQNQDIKTIEQEQIRRFTNYEEFARAYYPESAKAETPAEEHDENHDFGTHLAIQSLNRHAKILKFGDA